MTEPTDPDTLVLGRDEVQALLSPALCISAVEDAFRRAGLGEVSAPAILGMQAPEGSFHVKASLLEAQGLYFAAKVNANFPGNPARFGLPTIQGAVLLFDGSNGRLLSIMDSASLTALRTAAATAVAAKHLARPDCETLLLCGCGAQALEQLRAILCVRRPKRLFAFDIDFDKARRFADRASSTVGSNVTAVDDLGRVLAISDLVVTCTTATRFFVAAGDVRAGAFIAAVGADHEAKQEIDPDLMACAKVVTDLTGQASRIGDLHHAVAAGKMVPDDVHAELAQVVAGVKPGREAEHEIIVFDSTGTGLQDVAAAIAVHRCATARARR